MFPYLQQFWASVHLYMNSLKRDPHLVLSTPAQTLLRTHLNLYTPLAHR